MIVEPVPTRAEVSDVATAVYEGADAIMLSAESATGAWPDKAVETMDRIAQAVERDQLYRGIITAQRYEPQPTSADAISGAARSISETLKLSAIVCFTGSGSTGMRMSRERPDTPVIALDPHSQHGAPPGARLGPALRADRGRPRPRRHGDESHPHRLRGRLRRRRPAHHHHRRPAARHAGRHQHAAHRLCRKGRPRGS